MKYDVSNGVSRSAGRVFTAFRNAIFSLLQSQSFESISVQMLCNAADYPRSTFYNYFDDIYDLLDFCLQSPIRGFDREKYAAIPIEQRVYAIFSDLYDILETQRAAFTRVFQHNRPTGVLQSSINKRLRQEVYDTLAEAVPEHIGVLPREMLADHCCDVFHLLLAWRFMHGEEFSKSTAMECIRQLLGGVFRSAAAEA